MNFFPLYLLVLGGLVNTCISHPTAESKEDCLVATKHGMLRGKTELSRDGNKYCSYQGIPYTNNPRRFEVAEKAAPWEGIRDALELGPRCPQVTFFTNEYVGEEDCLYINVYYPLSEQCQKSKNSTSEGLPVLVNIHGGAFELGSAGEYGPQYFMDECTVFVSMNYRLGVLGFLSTSDDVIPGNLGLKDQVLSLKWIQENIECFGGNSKSVTLVGISAGSSSIANLITSSAATDLFHRAILQSGSTILPVIFSNNPKKQAVSLATSLNCTDTKSSEALKECLLAADVKDIVKNQHIRKWFATPLVVFLPTVEPLNATNPIHTVHPLYKLISGNFNKVPIIIGFTEDEGVLLQAWQTILNTKQVEDMNTKWNEVAPIVGYYDEDNIVQEEKNKVSEKIRDFYFGQKNVSMETVQNLTNLHSDRYFVQGIMDTVELHSRYAPTYPYVFSYQGGISLLAKFGYQSKVPSHGHDAQFVFKYTDRNDPEMNMLDLEFSKKLVKLWIDFARTGNPTETWPQKNMWTPYKDDGKTPYPWLKIDGEMAELSNYLKDRRDFWRNLGLRSYDSPVEY